MPLNDKGRGSGKQNGENNQQLEVSVTPHGTMMMVNLSDVIKVYDIITFKRFLKIKNL